MKKIGTLLAALAVSMLALGGQAVAQEEQSGATIKVDDDQQQCEDAEFTTINEAITAAAPGDKVKVCTGLYTENVVVNKTLELVGSGPVNPRERSGNTNKEAVVSPLNDAAPTVNLVEDDIVLRGFTVQEGGSSGGVATSNVASGYLIEENLITQNTIGLSLQSEGTNRTVVRLNAFVDNNSPGSASGTGIYSQLGLENARIGNNYFTLHQSAAINLAGASGTQDNVQIDHNKIIDDNSIVLFNTTNTRVESNEIVRPGGTGIFVGGGSTDLRIILNELRNGDTRGIRVTNEFDAGQPSEALIRKNVLRGFASDGIQLRSGSTGNVILSNRSINNGRDGIRLESASGNTLIENVMKRNTEYDAYDDNRPENMWVKNECNKDFPKGTICR